MAPPADSPMKIGKSEANPKNFQHRSGCAFGLKLESRIGVGLMRLTVKQIT